MDAWARTNDEPEPTAEDLLEAEAAMAEEPPKPVIPAEDEDQSTQPSEFHPKFQAVLVASADGSYGVIKSFPMVGESDHVEQTIGTWSKSSDDGVIHIALTTPLNALSDIAVRNMERLLATRRQVAESYTSIREKPSRKTAKRAPRAPKQQTEKQPAPEQNSTANRLQAMLAELRGE